MSSRFSSVAAPPDRPLPLWVLYPLFFAGLYLAHYGLLKLPWFWDEAGYYIPAALDLFRTGSLVPHSTLTNAHPPLPSLLLTAWWKLAGASPALPPPIMVTRTFLVMVAAAALLGVFRLARLLAGNAAAIAVTALTALYPIWFAQSSMAHADLFAAAFSLWALSFYFERRAWITVAGLFSLAALSKETAIVTPLALAAWEIFQAVREREQWKARAGVGAALLFPALPLACWYAYHRHVTGFAFGNPEFLRYNATANLSPLRILISLWHRLSHLFFHMNMFVPVVCALAVLPIRRRAEIAPAFALSSNTLAALGVIVGANALAFSILGGALLTRYLLPMYPLTLLVCVALWRERFRWWSALAALSGVAFLLALTINPPYSFAPEDNLTWRDFVVLHQRAIGMIARDYPGATVLTAWPATAELEYPDLGYTRKGFSTVAIENFSAEQIERAAQDPGAYDTALLFSTKWVPHGLGLTRQTEAADTKYFDFHRDLTPAEVAALLHGTVVWQQSSHGEWAAVLRFERYGPVQAEVQRLNTQKKDKTD